MGVISGGSGGGGGGAVILRVNGLSGTSISATLGSKTVSGTIPYAGVLELSLGKVGQWTVKATSGSYSFTQQVKAFTYGITEIWALAKKAFYDCTTTEIQAIVKSGMASQYWSIGDYHKITMTDGEEIEVAIADFNHDVTPGGVTIPVTLVMKNCFKATRVMNNSNTNVGGWTNSNFRTSTLPSILSNFPDEWQNIMTTAQKKTSQGNYSATIVTSDDKVWLLSTVELTGASSPGHAGEGTLYPIFTDDASRIKRVNNAANQYWTRSPASNSNQDFCYVTTIGNVTHGLAGAVSGISLGFCVG
jgi:hypothetical protein